MHDSRGVQELPEENLTASYRVWDLVAIMKNKLDFALSNPFFLKKFNLFSVSIIKFFFSGQTVAL